jgi:hypothetical protein
MSRDALAWEASDATLGAVESAKRLVKLRAVDRAALVDGLRSLDGWSASAPAGTGC